MKTRDLLLHPVALGAIALLLVNDHVLKGLCPGWWTGKLSDVAGMIFFPLFLVVAIDMFVRVPKRRATIAIAIGLTAVVFACVKCFPFATDAYRVVLGALQAPFRGGFERVEAVSDPTDLLALPFAGLACIPARRWHRSR